MKTLWNKTSLIEKYIQGELSAGNRFLFESRLLMDPGLRKDLWLQRQVLRMVRLYHRKKMKEELEAISVRLFSDPVKKKFQDTVYQLFKK